MTERNTSINGGKNTFEKDWPKLGFLASCCSAIFFGGVWAFQNYEDRKLDPAVLKKTIHSIAVVSQHVDTALDETSRTRP